MKKRVNNKTIHVPTGTIDNVWKMIKKTLPNSLTTKDAKQPDCLNQKKIGNISELGSGVGKTQLATTSASSRPRLTSRTLSEEKKACRFGFNQNDPKMGSQILRKKQKSKHMKMTQNVGIRGTK